MRFIGRTRQEKDALFFVGGVDTSNVSFMLGEDQYRWAVNAVNDGGIIQTRPGFKTILTVCDTGEEGEEVVPQFMTIFTTVEDESYIVLGISGKVYAFPFSGNGKLLCGSRIGSLEFNPQTPQIYTVQTVRTRTQVNGVKTNITPRSVLIMQDGLSRAAYWDGQSSGHLNPQQLIQTDEDGNTIYVDGWNQTPVGTSMGWSGNRLWVAQGNKVIASDINDPLYFTENLDIQGGAGGITFKDPVVSVLDRGTSGRNESYLFVWTASDTYTIRSGVLQRSQWESTADFVKQLFRGVGCIAAKSPIVHQGIIYWYSEDGVQSFDSIDTVNSTQKLPPIDSEMVANKSRICPDRSRIVAGNRDNYVFWSVPVGETQQGVVRNTHTQVLNSAVVDSGKGQLKAWQGIWTGISPVDWASGIVGGTAITVALSIDPDGKVRVWEAFQGNRADNGHEIPWSVETKTHIGSTIFETCKLNHFQALLTNIVGNLKLEAYWKGTRGIYKKMMDAIYTSSPGSLFLESNTIDSTTVFQEYGQQSRQIVSPSLGLESSTCTSAGVESQYVDNRDIGFSILFKFQGRGAISAYGLRMDAINDNSTGGLENSEAKATNTETGLHIKPLDGCPTFISGTAAFIGQYNLPDAPSAYAFNPHSVTYVEGLYAAPVDDSNCVTLDNMSNCYLTPIVQWQLVVVNGDGGGNYQEGALPAISAIIPEGFRFENWGGDVEIVYDVNDPTTFVTMPDRDVEVVANLVSLPTLTVVNGTGGGKYAAGTVVNISATVPEGQHFYGWIGGVEYVADVNSANTTVTMPDADVTVTAQFAYTLTVTNGTGDGNYLPGTVVEIHANTPEEGTEFSNWTSSVDGIILAPEVSSTTVTMPAQDAMVTAVYTGVPTYPLVVVDGTGSGEYLPATQVPIVYTGTPPEGYVFSHWSISGGSLVEPFLQSTIVTTPAAPCVVSPNYVPVDTTYPYTINYVRPDGTIDTTGGTASVGEEIDIFSGVLGGELYSVYLVNTTGDTAFLISDNVCGTGPEATRFSTLRMPAKAVTINRNLGKFVVAFSTSKSGGDGLPFNFTGQSGTLSIFDGDNPLLATVGKPETYDWLCKITVSGNNGSSFLVPLTDMYGVGDKEFFALSGNPLPQPILDQTRLFAALGNISFCTASAIVTVDFELVRF